ncbi:hypothetical protein B0O99DRAFT_696407 [Bisporella sp. PMI_857]|nr:hypothetical protein B0O99DRAFT_696407 [Bisporella sp. PMI_857]
MPETIRKVFHIQFWAWTGWFPFLYYLTTYAKEQYLSSELPLQAPQRTINARSLRASTLANLSFAAVALLANILLSTFFTRTTPSKSPLAFRIQDRNLNLPITFLWAIAHIFFSFVMLFTFFITCYIGGTILVASLGFSWSLTLWAPFENMGHEIENEMREEGKKFGVPQTGTIVGLNNEAILAPQIIAAGICSAVFALADALGSRDGTA